MRRRALVPVPLVVSPGGAAFAEKRMGTDSSCSIRMNREFHKAQQRWEHRGSSCPEESSMLAKKAKQNGNLSSVIQAEWIECSG